VSDPIIVLIEDEPQIRRFLRATLGSQGYRLFEATTGADGLVEVASRQPDVVIVDLGLPDIDGLEVIATPGHTREHVCYLTPDGDLFTGDTILGRGTTAIFPPDGHMGDYIRSLRTLRARAPRRIFPGHGPTRDDAVALIDEYIAHRLEREQQVLRAAAAGARTVPEMRRRIYPDLDPRLEAAAEAQITAHLIKLREEGRIDL